jgi:hypothetical protein
LDLDSLFQGILVMKNEWKPHQKYLTTAKVQDAASDAVEFLAAARLGKN